MNIGVDARCLMDKNRTGVGEYTCELLNAVFNIDYTDLGMDYTDKNEYYLFYNSNKDVSDVIPKWEQENVHYIHTCWPNKLLNFCLWLFKRPRLDKLVISKWKLEIRKLLITDYQLPITHLDVWFSPNLNFTNLSKKVKHIQTIHDLSFEIMPECFTWKRRLWHWFLNPRRQCKRADIILTPSENTKRDVVERFKIEDLRLKILYPGLPSHNTYHIAHNNSVDVFEKTRQKYNLPVKYILYLGTLEPRKNVLSIIEAFQISQLVTGHWSLVIAGSQGWKNKEVLEAIEKTVGVKYIGYVDDNEKSELYKNASLFVYPSLYEGFGLPVLEAMACGVPVITSNRSSSPEVVGDSAVLVNPYNVAEIAGAMEKVLKNEELRLEIIEKQKVQSEKFSWSKTAEEFIKIL